MTYHLCSLLGQVSASVRVIRNDRKIRLNLTTTYINAERIECDTYVTYLRDEYFCTYQPTTLLSIRTVGYNHPAACESLDTCHPVRLLLPRQP